jgi:uncharacterized membrane protein YphA (DoxX/SURF4 family)
LTFSDFAALAPGNAVMLESVFRDKLAPLMLRLALGLVCVYHGYIKIMANGGMGWSPGLPVGWQLFLSWGEFCAGVAIVVGYWCRLAVALVLGLTAGTIAWWQGGNVFRLPLPSLEPIFLLVLMGLALFFLGAGELSLDGRSGGKGGFFKGGRRK